MEGEANDDFVVGPDYPAWSGVPFDGSRVTSAFGWLVTEHADGTVWLTAAAEEDFRLSEARRMGIPPEHVDVFGSALVSASTWAHPAPNGGAFRILDRTKNYYYGVEV